MQDNLFYRSRYALITLSDFLANGERVNAAPIFSGNTYVQLATKPLLQKDRSTKTYYPSEDVMKEILGDKEGVLIMLNP